MKNDAYWDVFTDTGDPFCWLLCRALYFRKERENVFRHAETGLGDVPAASTDIRLPECSDH